MDQQPHERNEKDDYRALSNTEFSFKYTESGGITNRNRNQIVCKAIRLEILL
jgi:hypothetical protein